MKTTRQILAELKAKIAELEKQLDEKELKYPICCKSTTSDLIVLFSSLKEGKVLRPNSSFKVGEIKDCWEPHTNTDVWEEIPYDKERGLYHKQVVYCWDSEWWLGVHIRLYNAIDKCTFSTVGDKDGLKYENYSATLPNFMLKAHKTLKD